MSLGASQLKTLVIIASHPNAYVRSEELARVLDVEKLAAERRLKTLRRSKHVIRRVVRPYGPVYSLSDHGKAALEEAGLVSTPQQPHKTTRPPQGDES